MPEGPECHAIGQRLAGWIEGKTITAVCVVGGRYKGKGVPGARLIEDAIRMGRTAVGKVAVHGKMIYIVLPQAGLVIVSTLGLSGKWSNKRTAHCDIRLETSAGKVWFKDQLHYGTLGIVPEKTFRAKLKKLGPDVTMGDAITPEWWAQFAIRRGDRSVAEALMNQAWIAGVGNYLKAEIMYAAAIAPLSRLDDLPKPVLERLRNCLNTVPRAWFDAKIGVGPRQYMKVYGRKKCNGHPVVRTKTPDSRISHWVPEVQVEYTAH